jgi:2-hydroxycyclohexanecarboxyl-CoA dehydrogenase
MAKTALVTGAAVGIGRTVSLRLAREGMSVGVLDINLEGCEAVVAEIKAAGGKAIALKASVSDRTQMTAAVKKLRDAFGPVTVLVNNAGIVDFKPFLQITDDEWDRMYAVNVKGTFIATQIIVPDMQAAKWGRIINISSSSAQTGSKTLAHYSSSKGAIITLTRSLAQELGPDGITVNNVPPGSVMQTQMSEANKERFPNSVDSMLKIMPVRRMGEPNDIASAVSFLASEDSSYITGQTIGVNGGRVVS